MLQQQVKKANAICLKINDLEFVCYIVEKENFGIVGSFGISQISPKKC